MGTKSSTCRVRLRGAAREAQAISGAQRKARRTTVVLSAMLALTMATGVLLAQPETSMTLVLNSPPATWVNSVAVSLDGSLVATAAGEGGVRIYDARSGELLRTIGEIGDRSVVFTPDGRRVAAAGFHMDKLTGVHDVRSGQRLLSLAGHSEWEVDACAISPDGTLLASTGVDRQLLVWDLASGQLRHQITNLPSRMPALAFSPDGATLAVGGDRLIQLWDMETGQLRRTLTGHRESVCAVSFSPDGETLISGACDWNFHRGHDWPRPEGRGAERCELRIWDAVSGDLKHEASDAGQLLSLAVAPSGRTMACGVGTEVRLYDLRGADFPYRVVTTHHLNVTSVAFTPDGEVIISGGHDHMVKRTSVASGQVEWTAPGYTEQVNSIALAGDGGFLVVGSGDGRFAMSQRTAGAAGIGPGGVRFWDVRTGRLIRQLGEPSEQIMAVAITSDGQLFAAGGGRPDGRGVVRVFRADAPTELWAADDHASEVLAVAFAPDGSAFASAGADGLVVLRDPRTGVVLNKLPGLVGGATSLMYSSDAAILACGAGDGTALLWDVRSGKELHRLGAASSKAAAVRGDRAMTSVSLSGDGAKLATCTAGVNETFTEPTRIWDVKTGKLLREFPEISGRPMALSHDGAMLATGGKTVRIWDAGTGQLLRVLMGHLKRTQSIEFSADGRLVYSGGSYGTINAWEVASGRLLGTLFSLPDRRSTAVEDAWLAYHPDGYYWGSDGVERLIAWRVGDELLTPATVGSTRRSPDRVAESLTPQ